MEENIENEILNAVCTNNTDKVKYIINFKWNCLTLDIIFKALNHAIHRESLCIIELLVVQLTKISSITGEEINWTDNSILLYTALSKGNKDILKCLLHRSDIVNLRLKCDRTLLHYAVSRKWIKRIGLFKQRPNEEEAINDFISTFSEFLISNGANIYLSDSKKFLPLHTAIWEENFLAIDILIKHYDDIDHMCDRGTALHLGVLRCNLNIIKILLEKGAYVGIGDIHLDTPLHLAVNYKYESIAIYLLENATDISKAINVANLKGETALHIAAKHGLLNIIKVLIEKGAAVNYQNCYGSTPLMYAINNVSNSFHKGWLDPGNWMDWAEISSQNCRLCLVSEYLINNKADVLIYNIYSRSCLEEALMCNRTCVMNVLLKLGVSEKILNKILFLAINYFHVDQCYLIRLLIRCGADVNHQRIEDGFTLLHKAVKDARFFSSQSGSIVDYMETLINCAADVNAVNKDNQTPLHLALESVRDEEIMLGIVEILLKNGADVFYTSNEGKNSLDMVNSKIKNNKPCLSKDLVLDYALLYLAANYSDQSLGSHSKTRMNHNVNDKILSNILLENQNKKGKFLHYLSQVEYMKNAYCGGVSLYDLLVSSLDELLEYLSHESFIEAFRQAPENFYQKCSSYEHLIKAKCRRAVIVKEKQIILQSGEFFLMLMANKYGIPSPPLIDCSDYIFKYLYFNDFRNLAVAVSKNVC